MNGDKIARKSHPQSTVNETRFVFEDGLGELPPSPHTPDMSLSPPWWRNAVRAHGGQLRREQPVPPRMERGRREPQVHGPRNGSC